MVQITRSDGKKSKQTGRLRTPSLICFFVPSKNIGWWALPLNGVSQVFLQKFLFYSKTPWPFFTNNNWQIFFEFLFVKSCVEKKTHFSFFADILVKSVGNICFVITDQNFVISWCQKWPWSREIVITWFHGASTSFMSFITVAQWAGVA